MLRVAALLIALAFVTSTTYMMHVSDVQASFGLLEFEVINGRGEQASTAYLLSGWPGGHSGTYSENSGIGKAARWKGRIVRTSPVVTDRAFFFLPLVIYSNVKLYPAVSSVEAGTWNVGSEIEDEVLEEAAAQQRLIFVGLIALLAWVYLTVQRRKRGLTKIGRDQKPEQTGVIPQR